jgi:Tol biopolymer transport system component
VVDEHRLSVLRSFNWSTLFLLAGLQMPNAAQAQERPSLVTRITNAYPAYSSDGERIAYMSNADGDFDIYVVNLDRGERRQLTNAPDRDGTPAWSPDGQRIAFQSFRDGHSQVYVMDADGTNVRNLSSSDSHDEHPFWSSDGSHILFVSDRDTPAGSEPSLDLYVMDADGTNVRRITSTPETETYASWSPDGSRIVCRRIETDGNWEVVVLDANGSTLVNLSHHPGFDGWPFWSPDGTRVVFTSERAGSADLWVVDADGTNLTQLTFDSDSDERQPWWSADGRRIVYSQYVWFPDEPFYEASEIFEVEVDPSSEDS